MEAEKLVVETGLPEVGKDMLDLNKVPSKSDSFSSAADGSDYFSALGNAGNSISESSVLVCDNNADCRDDAVASDLKGNEKKCALVFPNADISREGMGKSRVSKGCEEDAGDQCGSSDDRIMGNDSGKEQRGMKKKVISSPKVKATELISEKGNETRRETRGTRSKVAVTTSSDKDLEAMSEELIHVEPRKGTRGRKRKAAVTATSRDKDIETMSEEVVHVGGRAKRVAVTASSDQDLETMSGELIHVEPRKETRGQKKKRLMSESCNNEKELNIRAASEEKSSCLESSESNVAESNEDVDAGHNSKEGVQKFRTRRRGRKRKTKVHLGESEDDEINDTKAVTPVPADNSGTVRRVLRSRTRVEPDNEMQANAKGNGGLEKILVKEEDQSCDEEDIDMMKMDRGARIKQGMRRSGKRLGRPPKVHEEKGDPGGYVEADSEMQANAKGNGGLEKIVVKEEDQSCDEEDIDMKMDRGARIKQGMRRSGKRLGRPPKVHEEKGDPDVYVEADNEMQANAKGNGGLEKTVLKEDQSCDEEDIDLKMDRGARIKQGMRRSGKRLGRPPKVHEEKGNPDVYVVRRGRPPNLHKEKGNLNVYVERRGRPSKSQKANGHLNVYVERRGRPRNSHKENGDSMVSFVNEPEKEKTEDCKESNCKLATESEKCESDRCQSYPDDGPQHSELDRSECTNKKDGELRRREAKQLVRDEIVSILKNAGWTIEHRPRMSKKDYFDAVYVDCEGRGYWSVTLAYKQLKARVDNGTADSKVIASFIPIPEEKLRTLFRITTGKRGHGKKKEKKEKAGKAGKKIVKEGLKKPSLKRGRPKLNRRTETKKRCGLLARRSEDGSGPSNDGFVLYEGKRTLLSWMIDSGTLPLGVKIQLTKGSKENVIIVGKISREGICCGCCDADVTLAVFQAHAGCKHDQPFDSIYLDSGCSLSQCLTNAWRKQKETNNIGFLSLDVDGGDPNDDTCNLCGDGGDLICCDGCPATFHQSCLQIQNFPSGDWRCVYCSCKFCEMIDSPCLSGDVEDTDELSLLTCLSCEEKFHTACIKGKDDVLNTKEAILFCGKECQKIFEQLQKLMGVRHEMEDGFSWTVLRCQDVDCNENSSPDSEKVVRNSKLALAFSVMDECFSPIIDPRSQTNMIERVVFNSGSNFRRLNYSGFCTAILERGDELVAAASIRIHGNQLAEMPFIGTRYMYRRQGMCRRLLSAIEMALSSLDVEKLVIPAVPALIETWTNVFGFSPLEDSGRQAMNYMSMAVFPGTNMLQKPVCKHEVTAVNVKLVSETSNEVASLNDEKSRDVGTPHSSLSPPDHSSEVDMQQQPVAPQCDSGTILSDDREILKCELDLNRDSGVECKSDDKEVSVCELELNPDCGLECKSDDKEIVKCKLELTRDCGVECRSVAGTVPGPQEKVLVDEALHAAKRQRAR